MISNRHSTPSGAHVTGWQWIAVRRFWSRGLRREAVGAGSRDGGLVGRACLETPDPRVEIEIDAAISPDSRQFPHELSWPVALRQAGLLYPFEWPLGVDQGHGRGRADFRLVQPLLVRCMTFGQPGIPRQLADPLK